MSSPSPLADSSSSGSSSDSSLPSPRSEGPLSESEGRPRLTAEAPTPAAATAAAAAPSSTSLALARSLGASVVGTDHASFGGDLVQIARERTRRQEEDQKRQHQLRGAWARRSQQARPQEMQALPSEDDSDFSSLSEASFHTPQRPPAYLASSESGRSSASPASSSSASTSFARPSPSSLPFPSFYPPSGFQFGEGGPTPFAFSKFARPAQPILADGGRLAPQAQLTEEALRRHTGHLGASECGSSCDGHSSASCSCTGSVPPSVAPSHSDDDHSICSCSVDTYSDSEFGSECSDASDEEVEANFHLAHEIDNVLAAMRWANIVGWFGGFTADLLVRTVPKILAIPQRLPSLPIFRLKMRLPPLRLRRGETEQTVRSTAIVQPQ